MQANLFDGEDPSKTSDAPTRRRLAVVPFGKFKDQPVETLLANADYAIWLLTAKYAQLKKSHPDLLGWLLMNFGSPESTPEHNRLQNRFLDEDFCLQLVLHLNPDWVSKITHATSPQTLRRAWQTGVVSRIAHRYKHRVRPFYLPGRRPAATAEQDAQFKNEVARELEADIASIAINCLPARGETPKWYGEPTSQPATQSNRIWEPPIKIENIKMEASGADVQFGLSGSIDVIIGSPLHTYNASEGEPMRRLASFKVPERSWRIEVKPFVGDDYPVVLRAMNVNQCNLLLVEKFEADGASWEQVKKIFAGHRIQVALLDDVLLTEIPACIRSIPLPTIDLREYMQDALAELEKYHSAWLERQKTD